MSNANSTSEISRVQQIEAQLRAQGTDAHLLEDYWQAIHEERND